MHHRCRGRAHATLSRVGPLSTPVTQGGGGASTPCAAQHHEWLLRPRALWRGRRLWPVIPRAQCQWGRGGRGPAVCRRGGGHRGWLGPLKRTPQLIIRGVDLHEVLGLLHMGPWGALRPCGVRRYGTNRGPSHGARLARGPGRGRGPPALRGLAAAQLATPAAPRCGVSRPGPWRIGALVRSPDRPSGSLDAVDGGATCWCSGPQDEGVACTPGCTGGGLAGCTGGASFVGGGNTALPATGLWAGCSTRGISTGGGCRTIVAMRRRTSASVKGGLFRTWGRGLGRCRLRLPSKRGIVVFVHREAARHLVVYAVDRCR